MPLLITGECVGVTRERRGNPGAEFEVTTVHVLDGVTITPLEPVRDFDGKLPEKGETVALACSVSAWKSKSGNVGTQYRALQRVPELEAFIKRPRSAASGQ